MANTRALVMAASPHDRLTLTEWLGSIGIAPARIDDLLQTLHEHWVTDVVTLRRCITHLEHKLPAAAFVAISEALASSAPQATSAEIQSTIAPPPLELQPPAHAGRPLSPEQQLRKEEWWREQELALRREQLRADALGYHNYIRSIRAWSIDPRSRYLLCWRVLVLSTVAMAALITPYDVSLLPLRNDTLWQLNRGIEAIFVLDVLVSSRVAFREHHPLGSRLVRSTDRIASRYVRSSSFALDVIAAVPWELFALALGMGREPWGFRPLCLCGDEVPAWFSVRRLAKSIVATASGCKGRVECVV